MGRTDNLKVGVAGKFSGELKILQMGTSSHINSVCHPFPLSLCVSSVMFPFALFHHLFHVLYKSYLIFSLKGMTVFYLIPFPLSNFFLCTA